MGVGSQAVGFEDIVKGIIAFYQIGVSIREAGHSTNAVIKEKAIKDKKSLTARLHSSKKCAHFLFWNNPDHCSANGYPEG